MGRRSRRRRGPVEYEHKPFQGRDSIRVLDLLPAPAADPLRCEIREVSLDDAPSYQALSYVWGSPEPAEKVRCGSQIIRITENCSEALYRLRSFRRIRTFWIDSICIDQDSPEERNHQVGMMGEVYSNASRVVVWLGEGDKDTDSAMRFIKGLKAGNIVGLLTNDLLYKRRLSQLQDHDETRLNQLGALFGKPWFERVWPVQEIALSRNCDLICGDYTISADEFMTFLAKYEEYTSAFVKTNPVYLHRQVWRYVQHVRKYERGIARRISKCTRMLLRTRLQISTDPRDKIFAFYGLLSFLGVQLPQPDYSKSIPQVYREAAALAIRHDNSLLILSAVTGEPGLDGLPSWVPDWTNHHYISEVAPWERWNVKKLTLKYHISDCATTLTLWGKICDTVQKISNPFPSNHELSTIETQKLEVETLQQWLRDFQGLVGFLRGLTPDEDVYASTREAWEYGDLVEDWASFIKCITASFSSIDERLSYKRKQDRKGQILYNIHTILRKFLDRKVLFDTGQKGLLGVTSQYAQPGDVIGIFAGCNLPLIVRPNGIYWRIVAPAYVRDVKASSSWWEVEQSSLEEFSFT